MWFADRPARRFRPGRIALVLILPVLAPGGLHLAHATTVEMDNLLEPPGLETGFSSPLALPDVDSEVTEALQTALVSATSAFAAGDYVGAERQARKITEVAAGLPQAWHLLGLSLANLDRMDEALVALAKAGQLYKKNAEPYITSGDILLSLGRRDEARAAFQTAIARDPSDWRGFESLATMSEQDRDLDAAKGFYTKALALEPSGQTAARIQLARLALKEGDAAEARDLLATVATQADAPDTALELLARAQVTLGNSDQARRLYETLAARGTSPGALLGLAGLDQAAKDNVAAEERYKQALAAFPKTPGVYFEYGNFLGATQRYDAALAIYEQGLALAPGNPLLTKGASIAEMRLGRLPEAIARAKALADAPTGTSGDLAWLGSLQEMAGDPEGAIGSYESAVTKDPKNWLAQNNLASLLTPTDPARAVALAEQAAAAAPDVLPVKDTLAWALYKSGAPGKAMELYQAALALDPQNPTMLYRLGVIQMAQGATEAGEANLKAALAANPDFPYAADARQRLGQN